MKRQISLAVSLRHETGVTSRQECIGIGHDDCSALLAAHLGLKAMQLGQQAGVIVQVCYRGHRSTGRAAQVAYAALQADLNHLLFGVFEQLCDQKRLQAVQCACDQKVVKHVTVQHKRGGFARQVFLPQGFGPAGQGVARVDGSGHG